MANPNQCRAGTCSFAQKQAEKPFQLARPARDHRERKDDLAHIALLSRLSYSAAVRAGVGS
jgi:hypothetical protein